MSVFDGTQATLTHVPPNVPFSAIATRAPRSAARIAAAKPAEPPPTTRKSNGDRKSTRLNSSHVRISYAVFCLKKKKHTSELQSRPHVVCPLLLEKKVDTEIVADETSMDSMILAEINAIALHYFVQHNHARPLK